MQPWHIDRGVTKQIHCQKTGWEFKVSNSVANFELDFAPTLQIRDYFYYKYYSWIYVTTQAS